MSRLIHARKELQLAGESLAALRTAKNLQQLDESWIKFLRDIERTWNKVRAHMKHNTKWQGWPERGRIEELRKSDPLLSYLRNARGAEEHGVADITIKQPARIAVNPADRRKRLNIDTLRIVNGTITELKADQPLMVDVLQPARFELAPVVNRGVTYAVPTLHEGVLLGGSDPITVGTAAIAFYTRVLDHIESEFLH
jgi:hypothetical protein